MNDLHEIFKKYESDVINKIKKDNIIQIINFLKSEDCEFISDLLEDYLDLFIIDYDEFIYKFHELNNKHGGKFLMKAKLDMNILEEFFTI